MQPDSLTSPAPTLRSYSLAQAAQICGVSRFTLHRYVQAGALKPIAGFKTIKISDIELSRFLGTTTDYQPRADKAGRS